MNILIRCDSSNIIGTGHVMRCLNLASYYTEYKFTFLCRNFKMNISDKIKEHNHNLILLDYEIEPELNNYKSWLGKTLIEERDEFINIVKNGDYNAIIIDHYGIDYEIERELVHFCSKLIVINDIFDFTHYCHLFINYNCDDLRKVENINLNSNTIYKIDAENIIINKKFIESKKKDTFNQQIQTITINMGGSDPQNYILKVLNVINDFVLYNKIVVNIVIGKSNNNKSSIVDFTDKYSDYKLHYDLSYDELIELNLKSDLAIGSLSITAYERLHLNIPQICLKIIDNQLIQELKVFNIVKIDELLDKISKYKYIIYDYESKTDNVRVPNTASLLLFN